MDKIFIIIIIIINKSEEEALVHGSGGSFQDGTKLFILKKEKNNIYNKDSWDSQGLSLLRAQAMFRDDEKPSPDTDAG